MAEGVKLRQCPWCEVPPIASAISTGGELKPVVFCDNGECPVMPMTVGCSTMEEASAKWNIRPADPVKAQLREALKVLERLVTELYPGDVEPDEDHVEEYKTVWNGVMNAREALRAAEEEA